MHRVHNRITAIRITQGVLLVMLLWLLAAHLLGFDLTTFKGAKTGWFLPVRAELMRMDIGWRNTIQRAVHVRVLQPLAAQGAYDRALQICVSAAGLDVPGMAGAGAYYCHHLSEERAMYEYCSLHCTVDFCQQIFADMCE